MMHLVFWHRVFVMGHRVGRRLAPVGALAAFALLALLPCCKLDGLLLAAEVDFRLAGCEAASLMSNIELRSCYNFACDFAFKQTQIKVI